MYMIKAHEIKRIGTRIVSMGVSEHFYFSESEAQKVKGTKHVINCMPFQTTVYFESKIIKS